MDGLADFLPQNGQKGHFKAITAKSELQRIYIILAWPSFIDSFPYPGQLGQSPFSQGFPNSKKSPTPMWRSYNFIAARCNVEQVFKPVFFKIMTWPKSLAMGLELSKLARIRN